MATALLLGECLGSRGRTTSETSPCLWGLLPLLPLFPAQGPSYAQRLTATQKNPKHDLWMTSSSLCCHLLKQQRGDTRTPCFCLPPQPQRPFPCFPQAHRGHRPLSSSWYLGNRPQSTGDAEPGARAAAVLTGSSRACSSNSPTATSKQPGDPRVQM